MSLEMEIKTIIEKKVLELNRPDLFREPLVAFSAADDSRFEELKNGSCGLCFKACPIGALKPDGMDKFACQDELNKNQELMRKETNLRIADTCGKCISVCPLSYIE